MSHEQITIAIVGLGQHGTAIAHLLAAKGYRIVGAVDVDDKVGRPLESVVPKASSGSVVHGTIEQLLAVVTPKITVLSASTSGPETVALAATLMRAGSNVLTLQADLLIPDPSWAADLDAIGKATGASFLSTGVQDGWWIHLPAIIAGSSCDIKMIEVISRVDANTLPPPVGEFIGIGMTSEQFAPRAQMLAGGPAILGEPLTQTAKLMGLTRRGEISSVVDPVFNESDTVWKGTGKTIPADLAVGMTHTTSFDTDEGVTFRGVLATALADESKRSPDKLVIHGTPTLVLEYDNFPGVGVTNAAIVNRIADILTLPGGVHGAVDLPPMRYAV